VLFYGVLALPWRRCLARALSAVALALLLPAASLAVEGKGEALVLATGVGMPYTSTDGKAGFADLLVREMFRRIGREARVVRLPQARALANANAGIEDGDVGRAPGIEAEYPNLRRVPESILRMQLVAWVTRPEIKVRGLEDFKTYAVGYVIGLKYYERNLKDASEVTRVRRPEQLFQLLAAGRIDVALHERWEAAHIVGRDGFRARSLEPGVGSADVYMYLHQRHEVLVPQVARALADMKADGAYQRIYDRTLRPLEHR